MTAPILYIGSTTPFAGKNTLNIGLGMRLQKEGLNLSYMKPVGQTAFEQNGRHGDEDAAYVQGVLGLDAPLDQVTPIVLTQDFKVKAFNGQVGSHEEMVGKIRGAADELSRGKDLLLMGGSGSMFSGRYCRLDAITLANELNFKCVIIDRVIREVSYDTLVMLKDSLDDRLVGVVLNAVPQSFMGEVENIIAPFLERNGIKILGILPQDPLLAAIRIDVLAEGLGGRIVASQRNSERVVESFLIGTMQVDNFMTYFRRTPNAAVIVGGDRADIQLVAIEGDCSCLILTGNLYPNDIILSRAEDLNVPIIMVRDDTYTAARRMERMMGRYKLRDTIKIRQAAQTTSDHINFAAIRQALSI
ncbi:MAG: AAA family ATPase [Deltaproteobacteria bacterium]|jgi:BioD-like phosphotransacetylase family protein|nr:AAA family ATPase [Deltaproteobacteria bacterium]